MSFTPTIPVGGIAGWRFLERTAEAQKASFDKGAALKREVAYFKANIGNVTSAHELVADRKLLKVALGAFGLDGELDKKAFIRKVLEEGTEADKAFAKRLTEPAYRKLAEAFGFGNAGGSQTATAGFADKIAEQYKVRQFEVAVGDVDNDMRLALNFRREIADLTNSTDKNGWYRILGSPPLRTVVEKAFGLPVQFGKIDVDRQRDMLAGKARAMFGDGSPAVFTDAGNVEKLITRFLARAQIEQGAAQAAASSPALALLQNANASGSSGLFNLITSRR